MGTKGYDVFFTEPGRAEARACKVCGAACVTERGVLGPTSFTQAAARQAQPHDVFRCPHSEDRWHRQALTLMWERDTAGSRHCREQLEAELQAVLRQAGVWV